MLLATNIFLPLEDVLLSEITSRILKSLDILVRKDIQQENLKDTIQKYIDDQRKGFSFAELTILQYQMLVQKEA